MAIFRITPLNDFANGDGHATESIPIGTWVYVKNDDVEARADTSKGWAKATAGNVGYARGPIDKMDFEPEGAISTALASGDLAIVYTGPGTYESDQVTSGSALSRGDRLEVNVANGKLVAVNAGTAVAEVDEVNTHADGTDWVTYTRLHI